MNSLLFTLVQQGPGPEVMIGGGLSLLSLFGLICCAALPGLVLLALWIWALVDCAMREFEGNDKIIWILVILLANWIGALIYLFVGRSKGRKV